MATQGLEICIIIMADLTWFDVMYINFYGNLVSAIAYIVIPIYVQTAIGCIKQTVALLAILL